ncbi:hypothetical protein SLE2022_286760 [Rubroshorea leprosula]
MRKSIHVYNNSKRLIKAGAGCVVWSSYYLGVMVGITPLTKSLPETSEDVYGFFTIEDDEGGVVDVFFGSLSMDSASNGSEYFGIINPIVSKVRTTSTIEGVCVCV